MTTTLIHVAGTLDAESAALIERLMHREASAPVQAAVATLMPRIGDPWPGIDGVYAGIARGEDGQADHHLVLLNAKPSARMEWKAALEWAKTVDGEVPTRFESALLYANVRDQLDTSQYHWTSTQSSGASAWSQYFDYGYQSDCGQASYLFVRAVRRLPL